MLKNSLKIVDKTQKETPKPLKNLDLLFALDSSSSEGENIAIVVLSPKESNVSSKDLLGCLIAKEIASLAAVSRPNDLEKNCTIPC